MKRIMNCLSAVVLVGLVAGSTSFGQGQRASRAARLDFDGDGRTDLAVFHAATGMWYVQLSGSNNRVLQSQFGGSSTVLVPGDYDGDGRVDLAVYNPSTGVWSSTGSFASHMNWLGQRQFGWSKSLPVPGNFDGDGLTDLAVYYPEGAEWYVYKSQTNRWHKETWGSKDGVPLAFDYDGDGIDDLVLYYAEAAGNIKKDSTWVIKKSTTGEIVQVQFGEKGGVPIPGKYCAESPGEQLALYYPEKGGSRTDDGVWQFESLRGEAGVSFDFGTKNTTPLRGNYLGDPDGLEGPAVYYARREGAVAKDGTFIIWNGTPNPLHRQFGWSEARAVGAAVIVGRHQEIRHMVRPWAPPFRWKPIAEAGGHGLLVMLPREMNPNLIARVVVARDPTGTDVLGSSNYHGRYSDGRLKYRFPQRGGAYGNNIYLVVHFKDSTVPPLPYFIPQGSGSYGRL